ncbi:MAG: hypothetical protein ACON4K_10485 [Akkermansiaceae bacterium]
MDETTARNVVKDQSWDSSFLFKLVKPAPLSTPTTLSSQTASCPSMLTQGASMKSTHSKGLPTPEASVKEDEEPAEETGGF